MDSLMAVEIKQALEREFEVNLTAQELRTLTFAKLQELTESNSKEGKAKNVLKEISLADMQKNMLFRSLGNEKTADQVLLPLNNVPLSENDSCAIFIPGVEGVISPILHQMTAIIEIPVYALQMHLELEESDLNKLVSSLSKVKMNILFPSIFHLMLMK